MKIRITDKNDEHCGKEFDGQRIYYDILHGRRIGGKIQDLYAVNINGERKQYMTHQIDEDYCRQQENRKVVERLGADVGDEVRIIAGGSGSYASYFGKRDTHIISRIVCTGNVYFDDGVTSMFYPTVEVVRKAVRLNDRQIHIMRHAIGLYDHQPLPKPRIHKCFRNRFMSAEPDADWQSLIDCGFATGRSEGEREYWYAVTRAGMNYLEYLLGVRIIDDEEEKEG